MKKIWKIIKIKWYFIPFILFACIATYTVNTKIGLATIGYFGLIIVPKETKYNTNHSIVSKRKIKQDTIIRLP